MASRVRRKLRLPSDIARLDVAPALVFDTDEECPLGALLGAEGACAALLLCRLRLLLQLRGRR